MTAPTQTATAVDARPRVRLFGQFLVEEGHVRRAELQEALSLMAATNATLGELAVDHGLMTRAQADEVNRLQQHVDGRWGELALTLQLGGLDADRLEELCWEQHASNLRLTDALVELGALSASEVETHLHRFEAEQAELDPLSSLPPAYREFLPVSTLLDALPRLSGRLLRNPLRISAAQPWVRANALQHRASASLLGAYSIAVGVSADASMGETFAAKLRCTAAEVDPVPAVGRFVVRLCDLVARRIASEGGPEARVGQAVLGGMPERGYAFDLAFGDGAAQLVLERSPD